MGEVIFILASGPSLAQPDIDRVRGLGTVIAINNQIFNAPWADILYACDAKWWAEYSNRIPVEFTGKRLTCSNYGYRWNAEVVPHQKSRSPADGFGYGFIRTGKNGGFQALNYAINLSPPAICLLGYDFQHTGGKRHNHPDHKNGLGNATKVDEWVKYMNAAAKDTRNTKVVNCSRETALTCFERMTLGGFIREYCDS